MPTQTMYTFEGVYDIPSLVIQIQESDIITVLDHIEVTAPNTFIWFRDALSEADQATLAAVIAAYEYIAPPARAPDEVITQNEKNDKVLKLASMTGAFVDGVATLTIQIPGTPGSGEGRWVAGGYAFTDGWKAGDRVTAVQVLDIDDLLGYGANTVLKTYHDTDLPAENQGWRMWPAAQVGGEIEIDPIGGYGFIPAGLYLQISFALAEGSPATWVCADYWWAKNE